MIYIWLRKKAVATCWSSEGPDAPSAKNLAAFFLWRKERRDPVAPSKLWYLASASGGGGFPACLPMMMAARWCWNMSPFGGPGHSLAAIGIHFYS